MSAMEAGVRDAIKDRVSVREHLESRLQGIEKAVEVAFTENKAKLAVMNEFRGQLTDQTRTFVTKAEHEARVGRMAQDVQMLLESKARLEGKASAASVYVIGALSIISTVVAVLAFLHR
jgi:hypothetical protein